MWTYISAGTGSSSSTSTSGGNGRGICSPAISFTRVQTNTAEVYRP
jgi:hypothetical protein